MRKDYYDILEITSAADAEEIKKAFRNQARLWHPDVNDTPQALEKFQEVQEAYEVLSDPWKKYEYDAWLVQQEPSQPSWEQYETYREPEPEPQQPAPNPYVREYPRFNYKEFSKTARIIGIVTFVFANSFLIDYFFAWSYDNEEIVSVQLKHLVTLNPEDQGYAIVNTEQRSFEMDFSDAEFLPGERLDFRKSVIYGFMRYRRVGEDQFHSLTEARITTYLISLIVYIAALNAIFIKERPERKWNAALIAAFFSILLVGFGFFH